MIEFGATLRAAREAKGLTQNDIAQATHLMAQQIEALECEDFSKIVAPIYGRGFVKLYCEAVGLDPKPLIDEFMELYNGNREPTIRMRKSAAPLPPPSIEEDAAEPPPPLEDLGTPTSGKPPIQDTFFEQPQPTASALADSEITPIDSLPEPEVDPLHHGPSRFTRPMPIDDPLRPRLSLPHIPRFVWRVLALAAVAFLLLWLVFAGFRAVYRATMSSGTTAERTADTAPAAETTKTQPPATPVPGARSLKTIPPLYID